MNATDAADLLLTLIMIRNEPMRISDNRRSNTATKSRVREKSVPDALPREFVIEVLRQEFSKRALKNPRYSQRSFAQYLNVSHTLLSLVMNGKREPSRQLVDKMAERFDYGPEKTALLFEALKAREIRKASEKPNPAAMQETSVNAMSLDRFALISEWQHFAILSLLEIPDTEFEPDYIANRLGISPLLAKVSMQRLIDLDLVAVDKTGRWKQRSGPIVINDPRTTEAGRKFQRQQISKAMDSLLQDPPGTRDMSSTTFAMSAEQIPFAIERIRDFRRKLVQELEAFGDPEEVYNLTVQIFPVSRRGSK